MPHRESHAKTTVTLSGRPQSTGVDKLPTANKNGLPLLESMTKDQILEVIMVENYMAILPFKPNTQILGLKGSQGQSPWRMLFP